MLAWAEIRKEKGRAGRMAVLAYFFFVKIIWKQNIEVPISNKFIIAGSGFYKMQNFYYPWSFTYGNEWHKYLIGEYLEAISFH